MTKPNGEYVTMKVRQLLPMTFEPLHLHRQKLNGFQKDL